ncbi:MAG: hypothetical protein ABJN62_08905 [Halioglobus sp.]
MNTNFKPLGMAAAVAAISAGYAGTVNAQASVASETELGDLAIVPYYTVLNGYSTGVNIINTSERTQVLKFRFRRAIDSMDSMDFNVVLSPNDMYTGFIGLDGEDITWTSNDNSCTAPAYDTGPNKFTMPPIFREGAETGYVEIISMGSPIDEDQPIAISALHDSDGIPDDCGLVRDNFFANGVAGSTDKGVIDSATTHQLSGTGGTAEVSTYEASVDSLKVSYFIKSDETGVEFGDNAVHISGFLDTPAMTNQETGIFSGDFQGFDHPDLNGGSPLDATNAVGYSRGKYVDLRAVLGAETLINDWSQNANEALGATVDTDWVVTIPGQYVMLNLSTYLRDQEACLRVPAAAAAGVDACDYRDIPLTASFDVYDREEQGITVEDGDLVVSPQPPGVVITDSLRDEVNVIEWGLTPVLGAPRTISVATPDGAKFGWASLATTPADANLGICDFDLAAQAFACVPGVMDTPTPVVGFAAWQRAFGANPGSNYGRIVEHSRTQSS